MACGQWLRYSLLPPQNHLPSTNEPDYPPIHIHPGASANIHLNIFPHASSNNLAHRFLDGLPPTNPNNHLPRLDPFILPPSGGMTSARSLPQCHHCDYRFSAPYLLTEHLTRNSHHCSRCRQCFPSWDEHFGCDDRGDGFREHFWVSRHNDRDIGVGGRILGEVEELERGRYDGTEGWVMEERRSRHRSRTRRKRGRRSSRGRYGLIERPYFAVY